MTKLLPEEEDLGLLDGPDDAELAALFAQYSPRRRLPRPKEPRPKAPPPIVRPTVAPTPRPVVAPRPAAVRPGGPLCRCCGERQANRPRGLCWTCYYTPGVRERFPSTGKYGPRNFGDFFRQVDPPALPTSAPPGSPEKIAVLEERAQLGLSLWHPDDAPMDAESRKLGVS